MTRANRRLWLGLALGLAAGVCVTLAVAELADVYLRTGTKLRGDVTVTKTEVIVRNDLGEVRFPKEQVDRIVPVEKAATRPTTQPTTQPDPVAQEYRRRSVALAANDVEGHFDLCGWLHEQHRLDLVKEQCEYVLRLDPGHDGARMLLNKIEPLLDRGWRPQVVVPPVPTPPLLSELDIQRLKMSELRVDGIPENVRVRFGGKGRPRDLPQQVLRELSERPDFRVAWEDILLRGQPQEKLQLIAATTGTKYAGRVAIVNDPEVFATFRTKVLPMVVRSCARSGCHTGKAAAVFRFPSGSRTRPEYAYTTFLLLDRMETRHGRLINRDDPQGSILLSYMLPERDNPKRIRRSDADAAAPRSCAIETATRIGGSSTGSTRCARRTPVTSWTTSSPPNRPRNCR